MQNSLNINADQRRILIDFGGWAETKLIACLQYCVIGDHYHKNKDEMFYIIEGMVVYDGDDYMPGMCINVPAYKHHAFTCIQGTKILGFASKPYDPTDEHKI